MHVLVIGSGIFGVTAALELRARGCDVTLVDAGPIPHPLAESTDISKIVRCDYGADEDYTLLGERALDGWRRWNATWRTPRFHETGVTFLTRAAMQPGGFEHDSFTLLARRGHPVERLDATAIAARFPAYRPGAFVDGYYHREGGWAESGATVAQLARDAVLAGVTLRPDCAIDHLTDDGAVVDAEHLRADATIVCAGAWTPHLVPELAGLAPHAAAAPGADASAAPAPAVTAASAHTTSASAVAASSPHATTGALRATGQPVFHLRPADPAQFAAARFPVFGADISRTGYYGFPINQDGIVKIANHGTGIDIDPTAARHVTPAQEATLRDFLRDSFPALAEAPIAYRRLCVYGDTRDGHFWIARHPARPNLTVAAGGSGHGFKFAPVLGELIADIALGHPNRFAAKFRWRADLAAPLRGDAARSS